MANERGKAQTGVVKSFTGVVRREMVDPIFTTELQSFILVEGLWKGPPKRVTVL